MELNSPRSNQSKKLYTTYILGIVVIAIIIALAYFLLQLNRSSVYVPQNTSVASPSPEASGEAAISALNSQGTSDSVNSINQDLQSTNLNSLDSALQSVDQSLQ